MSPHHTQYTVPSDDNTPAGENGRLAGRIRRAVAALRGCSRRKKAILGLGVVLAVPAVSLLGAGAAQSDISAQQHKAEAKPLGADNYGPGNLTNYAEGERVNFRFELTNTAAGPASGTLDVNFTRQGNGCIFFDQFFSLGTHDMSHDDVEPQGLATVSLANPVPVLSQNSQDWVQSLNVSFTGPGRVTVYYNLRLSSTAGLCGGSSQHSRLDAGDNISAGGQNIPLNADDIIQLPDITVIKKIDRDGDGVYEVGEVAAQGEYCFTLEGRPPCSAADPTTVTDVNGQVVFTNVTPPLDGMLDITETQLNFSQGNYTFDSGDPASTSCVFSAGGTATATVAAHTSTPTNATCIFRNKLRTGQLVVEKQIEGVSGGATFDLFIDSAATPEVDEAVDGSTNAATPKTVTTGTHSVSELAGDVGSLADFNTTIACVDQDDNPVASTPADTFATSLSGIQVDEGDTVTCVFTNTRKTASIIVEKQTNPDGLTQSFDFTASYDNDGFSLADGQTNSSGPLQPDTPHSVAEVVPEGWALTTPVICSNGDPATAVVLASDETVRCVFNNTQLGNVIIREQTIPPGLQDEFGFIADPPLDPATFTLKDGESQSYLNLAPGDYQVTQEELIFAAQTIVQPGIFLASIDCDDANSVGSVPDRTASITLEPGETVTCTFVNVLQQEGRIIVRKVVDEYDSGQEFPFDASYDPDGFSLEAGEENISEPLPAGTYSVEELVPDGWDLESVVCSDGSEPDAIVLDADETVVCTFTNEREPGYDGDPTDDFDSPFDDAGDPDVPTGDTAGTNDQTGQQPAPTVPAPQPVVVPETTTREPDPAGPVALEQLPRTGQGLDRMTLAGGLFLVLGGMSVMLGRRRKAQKA